MIDLKVQMFVTMDRLNAVGWQAWQFLQSHDGTWTGSVIRNRKAKSEVEARKGIALWDVVDQFSNLLGPLENVSRHVWRDLWAALGENERVRSGRHEPFTANAKPQPTYVPLAIYEPVPDYMEQAELDL